MKGALRATSAMPAAAGMEAAVKVTSLGYMCADERGRECEGNEGEANVHVGWPF